MMNHRNRHHQQHCRSFGVLILCVYSWFSLTESVVWSRKYEPTLGICNNIPYDECDDDDDCCIKKCFHEYSTIRDASSKTITTSMWPPWPISVIQRNKIESSSSSTNLDTTNLGRKEQNVHNFPSMGALFFAYARQQTRIRIRQVQEVGSQIWYNLPPSIPPLILLSSIPRRRVKVWEGKAVVDLASSETTLRRIPLFSEPIRSFVLYGLGFSILSWSNQELQRKRKLTPLALPAMNKDKKQCVSRVFLPPFLPEDATEPEIHALLLSAEGELDINNAVGYDNNVSNHLIGGDDDEQNVLSRVSPKMRNHLSSIYETTTATPKRILQYKYSDWLKSRATRKREVAKIRHNRVFEELVALQALKKRQAASKTKRKGRSNNAVDNITMIEEERFALVTGASKGLGRAIAVELARWEIPLVLVARDVQKLAKLAYDLEACYGVKCCVLGADLSKMDAAEKIHEATTAAGISVDILINNAGIASEGLAVDTKTDDIEQMVMLNSLTYAKLSQLYGRDMKKKRRGRMLMMSSMAGLCTASPNTAIYGATKAFAKSLSLSMAKEMEAYGVGVTCLIPGPVTDTDLRINSGTREALCWYLPFYSRPADVVAHQGIVSLLDGDTQTIPGWQNRVFANIIRPIIPQRIEVMMVQIAFSPIRIPILRSFLRYGKGNTRTEKEEIIGSESISPHLLSLSCSGLSLLPSQLQTRYITQPPPRFLKLPDREHMNAEENSEESNFKISGEVKSDDVKEDPSLSSPPGTVVIVNEPNSIYEGIHPKDAAPNTDNRLQQSVKQGDNHSTTTEKRHNHASACNTKQNSPSTNSTPEANKDHIAEDERTGAKSNQENTKDGGHKRTARENDRNIDSKNSRTSSKNAIERANDDMRIEWTKEPHWFDDDDDADDFSPRLGPIKMMEHHEFLPPNIKT